jgi:hypothetical protein
MAFLMLRIEIPQFTVETFNSKISDTTKPHEGINGVRDILDGLLAGAYDGEVDARVRDTTEAITATTGGTSANWNLK